MILGFVTLVLGLLVAGVSGPEKKTRPLSDPVECFEKAHWQTALSEELAVKLCRCARSVRPVDCYLDAKRETALDDSEIVRLCVGPETNALTCLGT